MLIAHMFKRTSEGTMKTSITYTKTQDGSQATVLSLLTVLVIVVGLLLEFPLMPAAAELKTDFGVYPEPPLQPLSQAGAKISDPVFGTRILRVTDAADGNTGAGTLYSYYPAFNANNTYLAVRETIGYARAKFFRFDAVNFTAGPGFILSSPPAGLQEYGLSWSGVSPTLTYGIGGHKIWEINVATQQATLVKDLSSQGAGGYLTQMLKSLDDDVFGASIVDGSGNIAGYVVYKRSTDTILLRKLVSNLDEIQVDKSGRYLLVVYNNGTDEVYDLTTSPPRFVAYLSGSSGFNHHDCGVGTVFAATSGNALSYRQLATPFTIQQMVPGYWSYSGQQDHFSMLADNEEWAMASRYSTNGSPAVRAFDNEIVKVATDGTNRVQRIAHHRSVVLNNNYNSQPKAAISRDGNLIAFTSNWGNSSGRTDVYVVQIESGIMADNTAPNIPRNLVVR
jgi:hypothetical protein